MPKTKPWKDIPNKPDNIQLGDFLSSINYSKKPLLDDNPDGEKAYPAYIINRLLSYHVDAIIPVSHLNIYHELPKKMQFDYLCATLGKRKRFSRFAKEEKDRAEKIGMIASHYNLSVAKARDLVPILTDEDYEDIKKAQYKGGRKKM